MKPKEKTKLTTNNLTGHVTTYYPNGQIKTVGTYINGKKDGYFEEFYENGELKNQCFYKDDLLHGYVENYNKEGISMGIEKFELGVKLNEV